MTTGPLPGAFTESITWILAKNSLMSCDATRAAMPRVAKPAPFRTNNIPSEPAKALRSMSSAVDVGEISESRRVTARIVTPWSRAAIV